MSNFVNQNQIKLYQKFVVGIREDLGRNVQLYISGAKRKCPNCLTDTQNQKSTGIYSPQVPFPTDLTGYNGATTATVFRGGVCPWCNGTAQITSQTIKVAKCLIRWLNTGEQRYLVQGIEAENDVRLKADIKFKADFENSRMVMIDGSPFQVKQIIPGGLRDLIQIKVFLKHSPFPAGKKVDISKY